MNEYKFVTLPDGTLARNKLNDAIKTIEFMVRSYQADIKQYKNRWPEETTALMRRQLGALNAILPVCRYELKRRKAAAESASEAVDA